MLKTIILQTNIDSIQLVQDSSVSFYVFMMVALFLIYIKLNKPQYFGYLFENTFNDSEKTETNSQISAGNINGILLQISFIALISVGIWQLPYFFEEKSLENFIFILTRVVLFYLVQSAGFFLFSFIIKSGDNHFPTHRLSQNEEITLIIFVGLFLAVYLPFDTTWLILLLLGAGFLFNLIRVSTYLTANISTFHIILYLCTLEILPVLFLLKFFIEK